MKINRWHVGFDKVNGFFLHNGDDDPMEWLTIGQVICKPCDVFSLEKENEILNDRSARLSMDIESADAEAVKRIVRIAELEGLVAHQRLTIQKLGGE